MITFTTDYNSAKLANSSLLSVYCIVRGEDENGVYETIGNTITFNDPIAIEDFNTLTKEQLDLWVAATEQYTVLLEKVTTSIENRNNDAPVELPWNITPPSPPPNPVPTSVTPLQIRMAINMMGLREAVDTYVSMLTQSEKDAWEYATIIERENPILVNGTAALGKTIEDLDNLFILASTLT